MKGALWALIACCTGVELGLLASELGLIATDRLRQTAYEYGGFWPGLLAGWRPNYPSQPYAMFLSYGFLHSGLAHLAMNMVTLWSLGGVVIARVGQGRFLVLYAATLLGGAGGYALLASSAQPMVGASGALFGLAGGIMAWSYIDRFTNRAGLWPVARVAVFLIGINLVMYWALDGHLAWQTHLGGFVLGWIVALLLDPIPRNGEHGSPI